MRRRIVIVMITIGIFWLVSPASAREPSWSGRVLVRGATRVEISSKHILNRPYRPFHFYGNAVRRQFYRGRVLPTGTDVVDGFSALVTRR